MKRLDTIFVIGIVVLFIGISPVTASVKNNMLMNASNKDTLCTPNPSAEAVALYRYLLDMNGQHTLTGTMWVPWGINEVEYTFGKTGKYPAIAGFDFIHQSANSLEIKRAREYWEAGGIPTIMWHWGAPGVGEGYEASKATIVIDSCFTIGTPEYYDFWDELETKADLLEVLRDAGVPVLWRPFHELNGGWFWWSKGGTQKFKLLWTTMYDYFVNDRGLNNLIWVLCYTDNPDAAWYPGDKFVDIIGPDTYDGGADAHLSMYTSTKEITPNRNIPVAYHECGIPPNPDQCLNEKALWSWWMEWHTDHLVEIDSSYLDYIYNHEFYISRDELPDITSTYTWHDTCSQSLITPQIKIGEGEWQETNRISISSKDTVILKPVVTDEGTWSWSHYGTSGNASQQKLVIDTVGVATAVFTNTCGATSTVAFHFVDTCVADKITMYFKKPSDTDWRISSVISVNEGDEVTFGPVAGEGGTWQWSGCFSDNEREVKHVLNSACNAKVVYTNACGKKSEKSINVSVKPVSLVENKRENEKVNLYPSPCSDLLTIEVPKSIFSDYQINIYSLQGILVQKEYVATENIQLNVSQLKPGTYFLKIISGNYSEIKSFIIY